METVSSNDSLKNKDNHYIYSPLHLNYLQVVHDIFILLSYFNCAVLLCITKELLWSHPRRDIAPLMCINNSNNLKLCASIFAIKCLCKFPSQVLTYAALSILRWEGSVIMGCIYYTIFSNVIFFALRSNPLPPSDKAIHNIFSEHRRFL